MHSETESSNDEHISQNTQRLTQDYSPHSASSRSLIMLKVIDATNALFQRTDYEFIRAKMQYQRKLAQLFVCHCFKLEVELNKNWLNEKPGVLKRK